MVNLIVWIDIWWYMYMYIIRNIVSIYGEMKDYVYLLYFLLFGNLN